MEELGFVPEVYSPYFLKLTSREVVEARSLGMEVIPWTVNEIEAIRTVLALGVTGMITDYPEPDRHRP